MKTSIREIYFCTSCQGKIPGLQEMAIRKINVLFKNSR
jgi:hypothetical protein